MIINPFRAILDIFLPRTCVVCGRRLLLREDYCCLKCLADLPYTYYWASRHNPMADKYNAKISDEEGYAMAVALFFYDTGSGYENITQHLKYGYGINSGEFFAGLLAKKIKEGGLLSDVDTVIPVPLHWRRRRRRGYNQAEVIASVVAGTLGARLVTGALVRKRNTRTQTEIGMEGKAENVQGAFALKSKLQGRHILLVDDLFTSGSTLASCQKAIREKIPANECRISIATLGCVGDY